MSCVLITYQSKYHFINFQWPHFWGAATTCSSGAVVRPTQRYKVTMTTNSTIFSLSPFSVPKWKELPQPTSRFRWQKNLAKVSVVGGNYFINREEQLKTPNVHSQHLYNLLTKSDLIIEFLLLLFYYNTDHQGGAGKACVEQSRSKSQHFCQRGLCLHFSQVKQPTILWPVLLEWASSSSMEL